MLRQSLLLRYMNFTTVLGFTGGIASGKSSRCEHLVKLAQHKAQQPGVSLGVAYISADHVGHSLYEPGKPCHAKIIEKFGSNAVLSNDGTIDRKKLGAIVFSDRKQMQVLNGIVWPHLDEVLLSEIEQISADHTLKHGNRSTLIILEAAVLIEQGFVKHCNDVWLASCSKEEAVKRIMKRNGLSEHDALCRVESQLSIEDRLSFLKSSGFAGGVEQFDTTDVSLATGLKQVSSRFDEYWTLKLRPQFRENAM